MVGLQVIYTVKELDNNGEIFGGNLKFPKTSKEESIKIIDKLIKTLEMKKRVIEENV